jgi:hypothetical protein
LFICIIAPVSNRRASAFHQKPPIFDAQTMSEHGARPTMWLARAEVLGQVPHEESEHGIQLATAWPDGCDGEVGFAVAANVDEGELITMMAAKECGRQ